MGKWFVDGYNLSRLAFNVRNRDAGWRVAGRRGENLVVPGRSGSIHSPNKPSDVGKVALDMWAVGADVDGSIPRHATAAQTVRMHLDRLTSLFRQSRLVEIVRVEDDTSEFGRVNLLANPSFSVADPDTLADVNGSLNGSAETEGVSSAIIAYNQAVNPGFRQESTSSVPVRRNYVRDPNATSLTNVYAPTYSWAVAPGVGKTGSAYRINMTGAAAGTLLGGVQVASIRDYAFYSGRMSLRFGGGTPGVKTMAVAVACYGASNNYLGYGLINGTDIAVYPSVSVGGWTDVVFEDVDLPDGTTQVMLQVLTVDSLSPNEHVLVDHLQLEEKRSAAPFFAGDSPAADGLTFQWEGTANASMSLAQAKMPARVNGGTTANVYVVPTALGTPTYARAEFVPNQSTMIVQKGEDFGALDGSIIPRGGPLSMSLLIRPNRTMDVQIVARFRRYTTGFGQTYQNVGTTPRTIVANQWNLVKWEDFGPVSWDAFSAFTWDVRAVSGSSQVGDVWDLREVMLQSEETVDPYFDGSMGGLYGWLTAAEGVSVRRLGMLLNWAASHAADFLSLPLSVTRSQEQVSQGSYAAKVVAEQSGYTYVAAPSFNFSSGDSVTFAMDIRSPFTGTITSVLRESSQGGTSTVTHTMQHSVFAGEFTRIVHSVTLEALGSIVTVSPVLRVTANAGDAVYFDGGYLGYDSDGDYVDGETNGWSWTTDLPFGGTSNVPFGVRYAESVLFWQARNGLMVVDDTWADNGVEAALVEATSAAPVTVVNRDYPTRGVDIGVAVDEGETYTFSVSVRARERARVELQMRRARLTLSGWQYDDAFLARSEVRDLNPNQQTRISVTALPVDFGDDWTHAIPQIKITDRGTSESWVDGHAVWIDSALFDRGAETAYFDGNSEWGQWVDQEALSPSRIYGPARRAMIEVINSIDMSSMAGGTRATFQVDAEIPSSFWEDTHVTTSTVALIQNGQTISLSDFGGTSASIEDAIIEIHGNVGLSDVGSITLTDIATGAWINIDEPAAASAPIVIDCDKWTVTKGGVSIMSSVRHAGSPRLLPLSVDRGQLVPRLYFSGTPVGQCSLVVKARRKFHLA